MQVGKGITTRTLAIVFLVIILLVLTLVSISSLWGEFTNRLCENKQVTDINSMLENAGNVRNGMLGSPYFTTLKVQWCAKVVAVADKGVTDCNAFIIVREVGGLGGLGFMAIDCLKNPIGCMQGISGVTLNCGALCTVDVLRSLSCLWDAFTPESSCSKCYDQAGVKVKVVPVREKYKFTGFDIDPETQEPEMTATHEYKIRMEKKDDYVEITQVGMVGQQ